VVVPLPVVYYFVIMRLLFCLCFAVCPNTQQEEENFNSLKKEAENRESQLQNKRDRLTTLSVINEAQNGAR